MTTAGPGVDVIEHLWIPLADGTRLAARLWSPAAPAGPVPAILEYIPYRKRDGTRGRDEPMHGFFAAAGYAAIRVDMRGSGDSDGLLEDEYLKREQDDALEVIAWIARQPWCTGAVGMMGKSWGGFNALQVAARRPPALKAIITVCSTEDRFGGDIHYKGGCLLNDNLWWGSIMMAYQARPPDPDIVGPGWRDAWLARLDAMPFWPALWLRHQTRDDYWRHGSVCEDWGAIQCPVLAVGGWADGYTDAVPRFLEHLETPRLGIIGPWAHIYPHDGSPGPAIDFLGEAVRWWDMWLKGRDTGIMREPKLRAFIGDWARPTTTRRVAAGRFVVVPEWPSPDIVEQAFHLGAGTLGEAPGEARTLSIRSPLWTGTTSGEWMGTGVEGEHPSDQRFDDGLSLCFDGEPLPADMEVLGFPAVEFELASDRPQAQLAVRLCDVAPDGASLRVSYAVLNLSHREGSAAPRPMLPHEPTRVRLPLKVCGHRFAAGHRLRLAVSTSYWPLVWPARDPATLTLATGRSRLLMPVRPAANCGRDHGFAPPKHGPSAPQTRVREGRLERRASLDLLDGGATYLTVGEGGLFGEGVVRWDEIGTTLAHDLTRRLSIGAEDPLSARARVEQNYRLEREGWNIRIETVATLSADADRFTIGGTLKVYEGEALVRFREWSEPVPRHHL